MIQITSSLYRLSNNMVNQYLIVEDSGLTLVDAGLPGNGKRVLEAIRHLGRQPQNLKQILITHADGDHFGAANEIRSSTGTAVYAHPLEAAAMRAGHSSRPLKTRGLGKVLFSLIGFLFQSPATQVEGSLQSGQTLPVLDGLQVLDTSGHTPGHLSFFFPTTRILFAGDSIQISKGQMTPSIGWNTWDLEKARISFESQQALNPRLVCAGHGFWAGS